MTLHNLWFIARLMDDLRAGVDAGQLPEVAAALRGGAAPAGIAGTPPGTDVRRNGPTDAERSEAQPHL